MYVVFLMYYTFDILDLYGNKYNLSRKALNSNIYKQIYKLNNSPFPSSESSKIWVFEVTLTQVVGYKLVATINQVLYLYYLILLNFMIWTYFKVEVSEFVEMQSL